MDANIHSGRVAVLVHGGAGSGPVDEEEARRIQEGCVHAAFVAHQIMLDGGRAQEAAVVGVISFENNPSFNAGPKGAYLNEEGRPQLDAGILVVSSDGLVRSGGVAALPGTTKNPILVARAVMLEGGNEVLTGTDAERFARLKGIPSCDPTPLITPRSRALYEEWLATRPANNHTGTVGVAVRDQYGELCIAVSTGGWTGTRAGRVGDVPFVGAGLYGNRRGIAGATGEGEAIRNVQLCYRAVERLARSTPTRAAELALEDLTQEGGVGGLIIVSQAGEIGYARTTPYMSVAFLENGTIRFDS
ncbi:MAG TPA: isoaspartyl peptidase/L-asparaginase [Candidatus Paceibacterota bacterium]